MSIGKPQFRRLDLHGHGADADFAHERVRAAVAALGGVAERQQEALVGARQGLQAGRALGGERQRLARQIHRAARRAVALDQAFRLQDVVDRRQRGRRGLGHGGGARQRSPGGEGEIQQAVGVIVGRAEHLAAGQVLVDGGDAADRLHGGGVDRQAGGEPRQGGAVGAQQEGGLHQVTLRLLDRQGGEAAVVDRAFRHHPVDGAAELRLDLVGSQLGHGRVAAALFGQPAMGVGDGLLAALDCDIGHHATSMVRVRGKAASRVPAHSTRSTPRG